MKPPQDPFWDELGVIWTATKPDRAVVLPRLQVRIQRETILISVGVVLGLLFAVATLLLGFYSIWIGWSRGAWNFVTRGTALVAVAAILALAVSSLRRVRASDDSPSLSGMLDLSIARSEKTLYAIRLGFYACGVATLFGFAGTAIRAHLFRPPSLSPLIDLAILAACAWGLYLYGRRVRGELAKYRYLKHALAPEAE